MTPERLARYDRALATANCDIYVSASSADVHYLTGSEDGEAFLVYRPGDLPTIVVRAAGVNCVVASARAKRVISFGLASGPLEILSDAIRRANPRRAAVGPVSEDILRRLASNLEGIELVSTPRLGRNLRRVKEPDEIGLLRVAAGCVGAAVQACFEVIRPGVSDRAAAAAASAAAWRAGADSITFIQVKAGPRASYPDANEVGRPFETDEVGFVDLGVMHRFYQGDYTRAFVIGDPPDEARRIVEVVDRVEREALSMLRPGLACRDFYQSICELFAAAGYPDAPPHYLGHGLGIGDDRIPQIVPTSNDVFVEGEVVCIEPGAYVPGVGGARIEDTVVVLADGNQVLSDAERIGHCR